MTRRKANSVLSPEAVLLRDVVLWSPYYEETGPAADIEWRCFFCDEYKGWPHLSRCTWLAGREILGLLEDTTWSEAEG